MKRLIYLCVVAIALPVSVIAEEGEGLYSGGMRVPVPDPTVASQQAISQQVSALRDLFMTRLAAMDKAIMLLQTRADKEPSIVAVNTEMQGLRQVFLEKFAALDIRFQTIGQVLDEREQRNNAYIRSTETNISTALASAKELVAHQNQAFTNATAKTEAGTKERLDQLTALFQTETRGLAGQIGTVSKSLDEKIQGVNARLLLIEERGAGALRVQAQQDTSTNLVIGAIGALVGITGLAVAIIVALRHDTRRPQ